MKTVPKGLNKTTKESKRKERNSLLGGKVSPTALGTRDFTPVLLQIHLDVECDEYDQDQNLVKW